ncbi:MAG TPA: hypothetical protein VNJ03_14930 [Vicinamibacterales bacterium]|nr:hypothetical protein [Vicinamibacterales bacterium]
MTVPRQPDMHDAAAELRKRRRRHASVAAIIALALILAILLFTRTAQAIDTQGVRDAVFAAWNTPATDGQNIPPHASRNWQDLRWRNVGPTRGGRVTAIAGVRSQPCTFYQGATGGGIWKTENCGESWTPIADGQIATGSIGSIDVSESNPNVVYVGTGSAAIRSNVIIGRGAYRSTDAGRTWQMIGLRDAGQIGAIRVHPSNPDIAWAAALGSPFGPNAERGVFKTTDGGKTWKKTLFVNNDTGARVVTVNMANPNELYAGMYKGFRKGWDIISGGPATEGGLYKSIDGGETWRKLASGLPQPIIGKIDIDIARSQPNIVYAMIEAPGEQGGLYRSDDSGATWRNVNASGNLRSRPFYFNYVDVNPRNPDDVWVNALSLHKSTNGGTSFTTVGTPHGDNMGIWFNPDTPETFIQSNDGGANVTRDGGRTWSSILNQPTGEFYMVSVDEQHPYLLYGPQQDNSTVVVPSIPTVSFGFDHPAQAWTQASGCETGGIMPTPDGKVIWGACKGELERFSVETGQAQGRWIYPQNRYGHHPKDIKYRFPRQTVVYVSPHDTRTVYQASHVLHRSTDEGVTWKVISPDLTWNDPKYQVVPGNPITRDVTGEEVFSSIYSMDESRAERGVIWVGANDGPVHVTRDDGRTWKNVTPKDLPPGGRVQNIDASRTQRGRAYIAVYRFLFEHDLTPYIYRTDDYGATWTKLTSGSNGIPNDHPTRVVREDPERAGLLYAGTEFGFFVSFDNGGRWHSLQQNLPATPVTDLRVHRGDLVISTMGRAFWIMDDVSPLRRMVDSRGTAAATPTLVQPASRIRYRAAAGGGRRGGSGPEYPPVALPIDYILPDGFAGGVSMVIADATGRVVRTVAAGSGPRGSGGQAAGDPDDPDMRGGRGRGGAAPSLTTRAGHNRFLWDYRWDNGGPLVAPGKYTAKLTAGAGVDMRTFDVIVDPGVLKDGTTAADLADQQTFLLSLRDTVNDAIQTRARLQASMQQAGVQAAPSPGPGESTTQLIEKLQKQGTPAARLQALWARLVSAPGTYEQPMLIDQLNSLGRVESGADQKVGMESRRRLGDLVKELKAIQAALGGL